MAFALIVASPFTIGVLAVAIRIARQDFAEYLALRWPSLRELGRAFAMMSALLLVWFLIAHLTKSSRFALDRYRIARQTGWLLEYLIALCIVAPITEGLLVRSFLFRGWSFVGPAGAILLSLAVWA
jgi:uncharacterized protein